MQGNPYRGFNRNIKIFYSYSETQRDRGLQEALREHLIAIPEITQWDHSDIVLGQQTRAEQIFHQLNNAHIILLLVSPDYMASPSCQLEMQQVLARHWTGEAIVIPIMLRAYYVENAPFANLEFLPPDRQIVDSGNVRVTVTRGVDAAVNRARKKLCLADAKAFVSHGDYDNALQAFEQAMLLASPGPRTQPLNNRSGDEPVNNPGRLRKVYKQAAQHDDVSVHELALDLFLHFQDLENALAACDTLLALDAKNAQLYGKKADILSEMKRFDQAQPYYRAAIALGSQDIQFYIKEGNLLMSAQKYQGALDRYRSASVIDPRNVQVHRNMAQAFSYLNDFNQALKSCELASSLAPGNPYIYNAKGKILFQLQRFIEALAAFEEAIRLKDDYAVAYENKGDTLQKLANIAYEQAKKIRAGEKRA